MVAACILWGGWSCLWRCSSEIVTIVNYGSTHLFVVVRDDYDDAIMRLMLLLMVVTRICLWWLELIMVMIVRWLLLIVVRFFSHLFVMVRVDYNDDIVRLLL